MRFLGRLLCLKEIGLGRYSSVHSAPSLVSLTVIPRALRWSRMASLKAQSFAALALALSSRTISISPETTSWLLPPSPALSSLSPRTPKTMSSNSCIRVLRSPSVRFLVPEPVEGPDFAELIILTASKICDKATGVLMSSQRAS